MKRFDDVKERGKEEKVGHHCNFLPLPFLFLKRPQGSEAIKGGGGHKQK
jgi:hypothetical protein